MAHFLPSQSGRWRYCVRFSTGTDIIGTGQEGKPVPGFDNDCGTFEVEPGARNAVRARGVLQYTGEQLYRWSGNGQVSFKIGPDSPENMLAYDDFAHTPNNSAPSTLVGVGLGISPEGLRKSWQPHLIDYDAASAAPYLWEGGRKGRALLGMFKYLHDVGANTVSMLLFNVGGDDKNVFSAIGESLTDRICDARTR